MGHWSSPSQRGENEEEQAEHGLGMDVDGWIQEDDGGMQDYGVAPWEEEGEWTCVSLTRHHLLTHASVEDVLDAMVNIYAPPPVSSRPIAPFRDTALPNALTVKVLVPTPLQIPFRAGCHCLSSNSSSRHSSNEWK